VYWWDENDLPDQETPRRHPAIGFVLLLGPFLLSMLAVVVLVSAFGAPDPPQPIWLAFVIVLVPAGTLLAQRWFLLRRARRATPTLPSASIFDAFAAAHPQGLRFRLAPESRRESEERWARVQQILQRVGADGHTVYAARALRPAIERALAHDAPPRNLLTGEHLRYVRIFSPYVFIGFALLILIPFGLEVLDYATRYSQEWIEPIAHAYWPVAGVLCAAGFLISLAVFTWPYTLGTGRVRQLGGGEWSRDESILFLETRADSLHGPRLVSVYLIGPHGVVRFPFFRGVKSRRFLALWNHWLTPPNEPVSAQSPPSKPPRD